MPNTARLGQPSFPGFMDYASLNGTFSLVMKQFQTDTAVHSYLLSGMKGIGKRTFAYVLAALLLCEGDKSGGLPCLKCPECHKVFSGVHPQIITLFSNDGKTIGVDQVREVIALLKSQAIARKKRIVMIEPMEKLTPAAQNSLLKSIEEPSDDTVFLLMTHELSATISTIASRCIRVKMVPWPDEVIKQTLLKEQYPEADILKVLPGSGGSIGTAKEFLMHAALQSDTLKLVYKALSAQKDGDLAIISTQMKDNREMADQFFILLEHQINQVLLVSSGLADASMIDQLPAAWQTAAADSRTSEINRLLMAVHEARKRKESAVNLQSNTDHLLLQLLEAQKKWQR